MYVKSNCQDLFLVDTGAPGLKPHAYHILKNGASGKEVVHKMTWMLLRSSAFI
jgi:hypothetical protein